MNKRAKIIIAGAASVAVLGGVGVSLAYADPSSPSPTPSSSPSAGPSQETQKDANKDAKKDRGERRGLLRRALHGEVTLGGEKQRVVVFQRGSVTQVSATAVAIRSEDGYSATYELNPDLQVRRDKEKAAIADVKVGTTIRVLATKEDSTLTARRIVLVS